MAIRDRGATVPVRSWVDRLPPRLRSLVPRELVGFAILGGLTFALDLALLAALDRWTTLPVPVAVTIAYVTAVSVNFVLNRTVNFRSRAPVGGQAGRYTVMVVCDYVLTVLVTTVLTAFGPHVQVSRIAAAGVVAVFNYVAARWWVFRDR